MEREDACSSAGIGGFVFNTIHPVCLIKIRILNFLLETISGKLDRTILFAQAFDTHATTIHLYFQCCNYSSKSVCSKIVPVKFGFFAYKKKIKVKKDQLHTVLLLLLSDLHFSSRGRKAHAHVHTVHGSVLYYFYMQMLTTQPSTWFLIASQHGSVLFLGNNSSSMNSHKAKNEWWVFVLGSVKEYPLTLDGSRAARKVLHSGGQQLPF